jgi:hypothetical protein
MAVTVRIRIARSATEFLRDVGIGVLVGVVVALAGLLWVLGPEVVDFSPTLTRLLGN